MKKEINIARIIWVTCLFLLLITILHMVMNYKINYQYSNNIQNKLYFYNCDGDICTTQTEDKKKELYSTYDCYGVCPTYKKQISDDYVILKRIDSYILYNYKLGIKISEDYDNYTIINKDYIIVTKNNLDGIINTENSVLVNTEYTKIGYYKKNNLVGYNNTNIIAQKDNVYGIINYKTGDLVKDFNYKESQINTLLKIIEKEQ